jgi:hypothetical protein
MRILLCASNWRKGLTTANIYLLLTRLGLLAIASTLALGAACGGNPSAAQSPASSATPKVASPTPTRLPQTTPSPDALVKCGDFPQSTYSSDAFGFSVSCPNGFLWETFSNPAGALFTSRVAEDQARGVIGIEIYVNDSGSVRDWIAAHSGAANGGEPRHIWGSTSNLTDTTVSGRPAVGFDSTALGPGAPPTSHAVAFLLPDGNVFVLGWGAYASDYAATLTAAGQQMVASIKV